MWNQKLSFKYRIYKTNTWLLRINKVVLSRLKWNKWFLHEYIWKIAEMFIYILIYSKRLSVTTLKSWIGSRLWPIDGDLQLFIFAIFEQLFYYSYFGKVLLQMFYYSMGKYLEENELLETLDRLLLLEMIRFKWL